MNRIATLVLLALGLTLGAGGIHGQEGAEEGPRNPEHTWYAQALARGAAGLNVTHFWSRGRCSVPRPSWPGTRS